MEEKDIRNLLGLDDEADIATAISSLQATVTAQKAVIETDAETAANADYAKLRGDLVAAQQRYMTLQDDTAARIAKIENERRNERAVAKVDTLIAQGKMWKADRETAIDMAITLGEEKFDAYAKTLRGVDLTELGVATGSELAALEPNAADVAIAKQMGTDTNSKEWRVGIMKDKARAQGLQLPEGVA